MTLTVTQELERALRELARKQGRDAQTVAVDAIREYVEAASITDSEEVGQTQRALLADLPPLEPWDNEDRANAALRKVLELG